MFGFGGCKSFAIFDKQKLDLVWPLVIMAIKKGYMVWVIFENLRNMKIHSKKSFKELNNFGEF
jgi:hypothetical protein